jgi:hypothetical protein
MTPEHWSWVAIAINLTCACYNVYWARRGFRLHREAREVIRRAEAALTDAEHNTQRLRRRVWGEDDDNDDEVLN